MAFSSALQLTSAMSDSPEWGPIDVLTVVLYFLGVAAIATYFSRKNYVEDKGEEGSKSDRFFLAGHSVPWWAVSASLFSANIGSEHFIALTGGAAVSGIAVAWYEWGSIICLLALGHYFLPAYINSGAMTMPEWIERRFNKYCRTFVVIFSLVMYMVTKIAATLFAGQLIITEVSDLNGTESVIVLVVGTAIYTVLGGLSAVVYTEVLQTAVLIVGGITLLVLGFIDVGGLQGVISSLPPGDELYFDIIRPASDPKFPWPGLFIGFFCVSAWYWCTDQVIVQRVVAAKNIEHGQAGCVGAAFLKFLPGFIMVIPGMLGRALFFRYGIATASSDSSVYDSVYPWMVMHVLPVNLRGLVISAMLSALMGHLAAVFNSCATIFAENVYLPYYPEATETHIVWVGRMTIVAMACFSLLWMPVIPFIGSQLFYYIQEPPSFMAPPILAMFLWGVSFKFVTSLSVSWTISLGVAVGFLRFVAELLVGYGVEVGSFLEGMVAIPFLYFAMISFFSCTLLIFVISWLAPDRSEWTKEKLNLVRQPGLYWELIRAFDIAHDAMVTCVEEGQCSTSSMTKTRQSRKFFVNAATVTVLIGLASLVIYFH